MYVAYIVEWLSQVVYLNHSYSLKYFSLHINTSKYVRNTLLDPSKAYSDTH